MSFRLFLFPASTGLLFLCAHSFTGLQLLLFGTKSRKVLLFLLRLLLTVLVILLILQTLSLLLVRNLLCELSLGTLAVDLPRLSVTTQLLLLAFTDVTGYCFLAKSP